MRTLLLAALDAMVVAEVLWVTGRLVEGMGWSECGRTKWCAIKVAVVSVTDRDTITHQGYPANEFLSKPAGQCSPGLHLTLEYIRGTKA
jgi:hypothetical protein